MNPDKQTRRWRIRPVYLPMFAICLAGVFAIWGAAELRVRQLEKGVWDRGEVAALRQNLWWLDLFSEKRIVPEGLRARTQGLLGDWNYAVVGDFELAESYYRRSFQAYQHSNPLIKALEAGDLTGKQSEFSKGIADYRIDAEPGPPVEDSDMAYAFPEVADDENVRFELEALKSVSNPEELNRLLYKVIGGEDEIETVRQVCLENRELIETLWNIEGRYAPVEVGDYDHFDVICDFVRLLLLDSLIAGLDGEADRQRHSNDAAYRLIGILEDNRSLVTLSLEMGMRTAALELMKVGNEAGLVSAPGPATLMQPDAFEEAWRAEYQFYKGSYLRTFHGSSTSDRRRRNLVLQRHLEHFRSVRDSSGARPFEEYYSGWMHDYRECYFRHRDLSRAEGERFAAALEDLEAEAMMGMGWINRGDFREMSEETRKAEEDWIGRAETKASP